MLNREVAEKGGLYVILSERHEAGRIDRQLIGRCGRQGEPGTTEAVLSLDDALLDVLGRPALRNGIRQSFPLANRYVRFIFDYAQRRAERIHSRIRRQLLATDERLGTLLAFSGEME
jgi:preprotein translocase subunit SecA